MHSTIYTQDHIHQEQEEILVRPVSREDEEGLREMLSRLSQKSVHLRFHAPFPRAPEWAAAMFANSDRRGESLVAVANGEIVGHAMYVRLDGGDRAEFAIVVEDGYQSRGIGRLLLSSLAEEARREGLKTFTGSVLVENWRMLGLLRSVFARVGYALEDISYEVSAPLP